MTNFEPPDGDREAAVARPAGRARRWGARAALVLAAALVPSLGVLLASWTFGPPPEAPLAKAMLPNRTSLVAERITYGRRHPFRMAIPRRPLLARLLAKPAPDHVDFVAETASDSAVVWITWRDAAGRGYLPFGEGPAAVVYDEHGCPFPGQAVATRVAESARTAGLGSAYGTVAAAIALPSFPHRTAGPVRLEVRQGAGESAVALGSVLLPVPLAAAASEWRPEPLPATRRAGDLEVTLVGLRTWIAPRRRNIMETRVEGDFRLTRDGKPARGWSLRRVVVTDATGNGSPSSVRETAETGWRYWFSSACCMEEPAWKVRAEFTSSERGRIRPQDTWTVRGVPIPKPGAVAPLNLRKTLHGVSFTLYGIAGPSASVHPDTGSYALPGAGGPAIRSGTRSGDTEAAPEYLLMVGPYPTDRAVECWVDPDRGPAVRSTPSGQPFGEGSSGSRMVMLRGTFDVVPGATRADLSFAIRRDEPLAVEFVIRPPKPGPQPPNPNYAPSLAGGSGRSGGHRSGPYPTPGNAPLLFP